MASTNLGSLLIFASCVIHRPLAFTGVLPFDLLMNLFVTPVLLAHLHMMFATVSGRGTVDFVSSRLKDVLSEELREDDNTSIDERITRYGCLQHILRIIGI